MTTATTQAEDNLNAVLRECDRRIAATKGALYLALAPDTPFELVTWYGYARAPRRMVARNDLIVQRLLMRKAPFWINGASTDPRMYDLLFHAATDSILVYPLYLEKQLVGFLDLRDKKRRGGFAASDIFEAREVADQIIGMISDGAASSSRAADAEPRVDVEALSQRARMIVERELAPGRLAARTLTEPEIAAGARVLPALIHLPGVVIGSLTAFGHHGNVRHVVSRGAVADDALAKLDEKIEQWARKQDIRVSKGTRTSVTLPFGEGAELRASRLASVLNAAVGVRDIQGLVMSVGFSEQPSRETKAALPVYLKLLEQTIDYGLSHLTTRTRNQKTAERLLEPDFKRYPELADHSMRVALLAEQFAHHLEIAPSEREIIRLAAYLHDLGFRLLDYERLYRKPSFNDDDMKLARAHPLLGAAIVAESPLGPEVATLVLSHHEQPDGKGYPNGIAGDQIPLGAKIIRICEAFDAMTSLHSYKEPIPESAALETLLRLGGVEFDRKLVEKFNEMINKVAEFGEPDEEQ
jgi:putative nucleotidyltransferase with HDIG domain